MPIRKLLFSGDIEEFSVYPQVVAMRGVCQDSTHHPEGDVLTHTRYVLEAMRRIVVRETCDEQRATRLLLAALCHDMGKPHTTAINDAGRVTAHGHDRVGVESTRAFLRLIGIDDEAVVMLVRYHMVHIRFVPTIKAINRLKRNLLPATIEDLALLIEADLSGRPPFPARRSETMMNVLSLIAESEITQPRPRTRIITGDILLKSTSISPGPIMGRVLTYLDEMQSNECFSTIDEGVRLAVAYIERKAGG